MEFALVFPFLILLLIVILESGWLFAQYLDVRHGAREGVRLATVNHPEGAHPAVVTRTQANHDALHTETCDRMNIASGAMVTFTSVGGVGDSVTVTATSPPDTLSGFVDWALPSGMMLTSSALLHAEQEATWANTDVGLYPDGKPCP